jgi:uncharacterized protein (DUF1778 family)
MMCGMVTTSGIDDRAMTDEQVIIDMAAEVQQFIE